LLVFFYFYTSSRTLLHSGSGTAMSALESPDPRSKGAQANDHSQRRRRYFLGPGGDSGITRHSLYMEFANLNTLSLHTMAKFLLSSAISEKFVPGMINSSWRFPYLLQIIKFSLTSVIDGSIQPRLP
jgi:hypothetical protein